MLVVEPATTGDTGPVTRNLTVLPAITVTVVLPLIKELMRSVAVSVTLPAVFRVTE